MMRTRRFRYLGFRLVGVVFTLLLVPAMLHAAQNGGEDLSADASNLTLIRSAPQRSAAQLLAAVERAWMAGDAGALASYCDSASARVSLKPGGSPASAPTLGGVGFLIQDQLHLVATRTFRIVRFEVDRKKRTARAWARWNGAWGGARGVREVEVVLSGRARSEGQWRLTEIRASD
jgi:hypothetical protein